MQPELPEPREAGSAAQVAVPPATATLQDWLDYLERLHAKPIDLGLERVRAVHDRMPPRRVVPVVTVGGTNGKGSTTAYLEAVLRAAGYRTGCYTSPHLLSYNERIRVGGHMASDAEIIASFQAVESARGGTPLTYFEFGTLAALHHFGQSAVDALVLEVGLGGRLDAVNIVEPDCAVVTSVALDHMEFLGPDRESIAREKAGIFRAGRPAVFGEADVPASLAAHAAEIGALLHLAGRDFSYRSTGQQWSFHGPRGAQHALPYPALRGAWQLDNAACALAALDLLRDRLPVAQQHVREGLVTVNLPGRLQVLPGRPAVILDVAHNPHAAAAVAGGLARMGGFRRTLLVLGMLQDKDIAGVLQLFEGLADAWFLADLQPPRGARAVDLAAQLDHPRAPVHCHASPGDALRAALAQAGPDDRVVVSGSFLTVAAAMVALQRTEPAWGS